MTPVHATENSESSFDYSSEYSTDNESAEELGFDTDVGNQTNEGNDSASTETSDAGSDASSEEVSKDLPFDEATDESSNESSKENSDENPEEDPEPSPDAQSEGESSDDIEQYSPVEGTFIIWDESTEFTKPSEKDVSVIYSQRELYKDAVITDKSKSIFFRPELNNDNKDLLFLHFIAYGTDNCGKMKVKINLMR